MHEIEPIFKQRLNHLIVRFATQRVCYHISLADRNPWWSLTIFVASYSAQIGWRCILNFYDLCNYDTCFPANSASRSSEHAPLLLTQGRELGSWLRVFSTVLKRKLLLCRLASAHIPNNFLMSHKTHQKASRYWVALERERWLVSFTRCGRLVHTLPSRRTYDPFVANWSSV